MAACHFLFGPPRSLCARSAIWGRLFYFIRAHAFIYFTRSDIEQSAQCASVRKKFACPAQVHFSSVLFVCCSLRLLYNKHSVCLFGRRRRKSAKLFSQSASWQERVFLKRPPSHFLQVRTARVEWLAAQTRFWNNVSWQINLFGSFCTYFSIKDVQVSHSHKNLFYPCNFLLN